MGGNTFFVEQQSFSNGKTIFHRGDEGGCMYSVDSGSVGIFIDYGTPGQKLLKKLGPGEFFGEMGMVRGLPRSADAVSLAGDTVLSVIKWETLAAYFKESPARIVAIMQQLAQRVEELSTDYIGACGALTEAVAENREIKSRFRALEEERDKLRNGIVDLPGKPRPPMWRKLEGESKEDEDARFRKYLEAYQEYRKKN